MKKIGKFLVVAILGIVTFACSNKDEDDTNPPVTTDGAVVEFQLLNASTRANSEEGTDLENKVNYLDVYIFKSAGEQLLHRRFPAVSGHRYSIPILQPEDDMKFLVAANFGEPGEGKGDIVGTYDVVKATLLNETDYIFTKFTENESGNALKAQEPFVMSGWAVSSVTPSTPSVPSPTTIVPVEMHRLASKIEAPKLAKDFEVDIPQEQFGWVFPEDNVPQNGVKFDMLGYVLINGLNKTDLFYTWNASGLEGDTWDTWSRTNKLNLTSTFNSSKHYTSVYAGTTSTADGMFLAPGDQVMYVYESRPKDYPDDPNVYWDPTSVYSFIVKGKLTDNDDSDNSVIRYWRASIGQSDHYKIFRNSIYRATLQGVNNIGSSTPEGAEEPPINKEGFSSVIIRLEIVDWRVRSFDDIIL